MAFYARRKLDEEIVRSGECPRRERGEYECLYCRRDVYQRGGDRTSISAQFAHYPNESCDPSATVAEGKKHVEAIDNIIDHLREKDGPENIVVNENINGTVPDVLFDSDGYRYGVEIQVSNISADEVIERTIRRSKRQVSTLWLFHTDTFGTTTQSSSGNEYIKFKTGETGYVALHDEDYGHESVGTVGINYYCPERGGLGYTQYVKLFDDAMGGWSGTSNSLRIPAIEITKSGNWIVTDKRFCSWERTPERLSEVKCKPTTDSRSRVVANQNQAGLGSFL